MRVQEGRGSVKTPFFIFKKNIKFLILGIDNISRLVYYMHINKKDKEKPKMTKIQIEQLEYQFNYYSRRFALYEDERYENRARMNTLQRAVKIF